MLQGFWGTLTSFSIRDVSFLVSMVFTSGCFVLVVNACLSFVPFVSAKLKLPVEIIYLEGVLSVMSCGLFMVGSAFAYLEAVNAHRGGCFGWRLKQGPDSESADSIVEKGFAENGINIRNEPEEELSTIAQIAQTNIVGRPRGQTLTTAVEITVVEKEERESIDTAYKPEDKDTWRFFPTFHEIKTQHLYQIGFMATALFFCCSFIYFATSVASLATILSTGEIARWIRYPQLVAAIGFAIASVLLMIENQTQWWRPAIRKLGWHMNFWNLVGSCGFIFCAVFALVQNVTWAQYQFTCSYLWGSWAFLFGSVVQWYKSVNRHRQALRRAKEAG